MKKYQTSKRINLLVIIIFQKLSTSKIRKKKQHYFSLSHPRQTTHYSLDIPYQADMWIKKQLRNCSQSVIFNFQTANVLLKILTVSLMCSESDSCQSIELGTSPGFTSEEEATGQVNDFDSLGPKQ